MSELLYSSSSSLPAWDLPNLGSVFQQDFPTDTCDAVEESPEQIFGSPEMEFSDVSTGYLEDALIEFSERHKRRRLSFCVDDQAKFLDDISQNNWGLSGNYSCMNSQLAADEHKSGMGNVEEAFSDVIFESPNSSSSSDRSVQEKSPVYPKVSPEPTSSYTGNNEHKKTKKRVVYPFALVKPGGGEDDVTLNDINERILMPPTRPVRHPVGDFAYRPCVSAHGPGLSGKAVVALTRIQTQGRGTITIIRTKG
ncbi:PREDICTED: protein XRI1 [Tarenaya hassleriana]|uniref:protein XRI1 n=1 Tax=Tarenaya hassleriana TaxID=28532 RepID=UPI00053C9867|nr:PREDICTED: protein XRI1 [Tarenaya hassleriana]